MAFGEKLPSEEGPAESKDVGLWRRAEMKDIPQDLVWKDMFSEMQKKFPEIRNKLSQEKVLLKVSPQNVVQTNLAEIVKGLATYTDWKNGAMNYLPGKGPVRWLDNLIGKDTQGNALPADRVALGQHTINNIQRGLQHVIPEAEVAVDSTYNSSTELALMLASAALGVSNIQFEGRKQTERVVKDNISYRYRLANWKRNGEARSSNELPPEKPTEKTIEKKERKITAKEKKEVIDVKEKWLHPAEYQSPEKILLIRDCTLPPEKIAALQKSFAAGSKIDCKITASVDHRQVAERSWEKVDALYEEAKTFMIGAKGEKTLFKGLRNELLTRTAAFKELQMPGGPERNKQLLIARAVASIKELFNTVMVPYLREKRTRENLTDDKVILERNRLISMIKITDLKVGAKTSKDLQQDRYTSFSA